MRLCPRNGSDRLLTELVKQGINIVLPPREGIAAGSLLISDGKGPARLASWPHVLGVSPAIQSDEEPTFRGMTFSASDALTAEAGGSVMGAVMAGLGMGEGKLTAAFKKAGAKSLHLSLSAPAVHVLKNLDSVLDELRAASAERRPGYEDRRLFIVSKVWRARGLAVKLHREDGTTAALSVAATRELEGAAQVQIRDMNDGALTFVADKALIFGLTLVEIAILGGTVTDHFPEEHLPIRGREGGPLLELGEVPVRHAFLSDELFSEMSEDLD